MFISFPRPRALFLFPTQHRNWLLGFVLQKFRRTIQHTQYNSHGIQLPLLSEYNSAISVVIIGLRPQLPRTSRKAGKPDHTDESTHNVNNSYM